MANPPGTRTHKAYAFSRQARKFGRLLECGSGFIDKERGIAHIFMDRAPLQGYTGYIVLSPIGVPPPKVEPPQLSDDEGD